jgi:hypothetical protein
MEGRRRVPHKFPVHPMIAVFMKPPGRALIAALPRAGHGAHLESGITGIR